MEVPDVRPGALARPLAAFKAHGCHRHGGKEGPLEFSAVDLTRLSCQSSVDQREGGWVAALASVY